MSVTVGVVDSLVLVAVSEGMSASVGEGVAEGMLVLVEVKVGVAGGVEEKVAVGERVLEAVAVGVGVDGRVVEDALAGGGDVRLGRRVSVGGRVSEEVGVRVG